MPAPHTPPHAPPHTTPRAAPAHLIRHEIIYRSAARDARASMVDCGYMQKPGGDHAYSNRVMPHYIGVYIFRGTGTFTDWNDQIHRVGPGDYLQHPPGLRHSVIPDPDGQWAEFFITFNARFYQALSDLGDLNTQSPLLKPGLSPEIYERVQSLFEVVSRGGERESSLMLLRAHELWVTVDRLHDRGPQASGPYDAAIDGACRELGESLELEIDFQALAENHHLSYERFRKLFRDRVGVPPGEYRIRRRIDRARRLIAQDHMSNKAAAYALGYPDPFTFSKQFKRYVGMSPSAFRNTL